MDTPANTIQQKVHELADQLPANATWEDVIELARCRRVVEAGIAAADLGSFASDEDIRSVFAKWGVKT